MRSKKALLALAIALAGLVAPCSLRAADTPTNESNKNQETGNAQNNTNSQVTNPSGNIDQVVGAPTTDSEPFKYIEDLRAVASDEKSHVANGYSNLAVIINRFARILLIGAAVMFFFLVLVSGFRLVFATNKQGALEENKRNLTTGIIGLLVVFAAYWIVEIIFALTGVSVIK